jgi:hypothetical protein
MNNLLNLVVKGDLRNFKNKIFKACDTKFTDMKNALKKDVGAEISEGDARGGGIKLGMSGKTKDGKKIKVLKKLGKKNSDGFLVNIDGEEKEMHPGEMNKIKWS